MQSRSSSSPGSALLQGLLCTVLLVGCGDDDGGGSTIAECNAFKACGGDVVGQWQLDGMCLEGIEQLLGGIAEQKGCETFFRTARLKPEGTYMFGTDGMLTTTGASVAFDIDVVLTDACAKGIGGANASVDAAACDRLETNLGEDNTTLAGASCSFGSGGCACTVHSVRMSIEGAGPYMVAGTDLIQGTERNPFCVQGNTLSIRSTTAMRDGTLILHR